MASKIFELRHDGFVNKAIKAPNSSEKPRAWFDKLNQWARGEGQKGLGYVIFENNEFKGPISNNMKQENLINLQNIVNLENSDSVFFICDELDNASKLSSIVREKSMMNYL